MAFFEPTFTDGTIFNPVYASNPFVTGFNFLQTSSTTFTLSAGTARAYALDYGVSYPPTLVGLPSNLSLDTTTVGALGCFPISAATAATVHDTAFPIMVIGYTPGTVAIPYQQVQNITAVVATGNNFLPPGYNCWARVGTAFFEAGTNTMRYYTQSGNGNLRRYILQSAIVVANTSEQANTKIDLSSQTADLPINPNFVGKVGLLLDYTPASAANILSLLPQNLASAIAPIQLKTNGVAEVIANVEMVPSVIANDAAVWYINTGAGDSLSIALYGWEEDLGLQAI